MKGKNSDILAAISIAAGAGITILCILGGGLFIGYEVDVYCGTKPWGALIGGLLGGIIGVYSLVKQLLSTVD